VRLGLEVNRQGPAHQWAFLLPLEQNREAMALAVLARRPRRGCCAVAHPAAPWVDKAAPRHPRRNPSSSFSPLRPLPLYSARSRARPRASMAAPPPRSCGHRPPSAAPPSPGGSPSTATSSSRIRSSQAPPHHRDRLLQPSTIVIHYVDSPPSLQHRLHRDLPELPCELSPLPCLS
jgi:hypothetical protein